MSSKPESRLINSIHKHLPESLLHHEKMHNIYRAGTFDCWYSGDCGDMWIEYKWIPKMPKRGKVIPKLSTLQYIWGVERQAEGRKVLVAVGCPDGIVKYPDPFFWKYGYPVEVFRTLLVSRMGMAEFIRDKCGTKPEIKQDSSGDSQRIQDSGSRIFNLPASFLETQTKGN